MGRVLAALLLLSFAPDAGAREGDRDRERRRDRAARIDDDDRDNRDDDESDRRVLVLDLGGDVDEESRRAITALVARNLTRRGLAVMSGDDVRGLMQLEGEKQMAGCSGDESCLSEIAGALDARLVVSGFAGRLGSLIVVNLSLFDARTGTAHGRATVEADSLEELPQKLEPAVDELVADFLPKSKSNLGPILVTSGGAVALAAGVATGIGAALLYSDHESKRAALLATSARFEQDDDVDVSALADGYDDVEQARLLWNNVGTGLAWTGVVLGAVGVAAVGGGVAWLVSGRDEE